MNNLNANRFHQEKIELLENPYEYYEGLEDITSAESILTFKHGVAKQAFVNGYRAIFLKTSPHQCEALTENGHPNSVHPSLESKTGGCIKDFHTRCESAKCTKAPLPIHLNCTKLPSCIVLK